MTITLCILAWGSPLFVHAQSITLQNPSFEETPGPATVPRAWIYRGFPNETPPDILPFRANSYYPDTIGGQLVFTASKWNYGVSLPAYAGKTYLGMVTRDNKTWESLSQLLSPSLYPDTCYRFTLYLASSPHYHSISRSNGQPTNYNTPTRLAVSSLSQTGEIIELLGVTSLVDHPNWLPYTLILHPKKEVEQIQLSAWHQTNTVASGNLLIDAIQPLTACSCRLLSEAPDIDTLSFTVPETRQQREAIITRTNLCVSIRQRTITIERSTFRIKGQKRAVFDHPDWYAAKAIVRKYPKEWVFIIHSSSKQTYRKVKKWIKNELPSVSQHLICIHSIPDKPTAANQIYMRLR